MDAYMISVIVIPAVFFGLFWSLVAFCFCTRKCEERRAQRQTPTTQQFPQSGPFFNPPTQPDGAPLPYYVIYVPASDASTGTIAPSHGTLPVRYYIAHSNDSPPKYEDIVNDSNINRY